MARGCSFEPDAKVLFNAAVPNDFEYSFGKLNTWANLIQLNFVSQANDFGVFLSADDVKVRIRPGSLWIEISITISGIAAFLVDHGSTLKKIGDGLTGIAAIAGFLTKVGKIVLKAWDSEKIQIEENPVFSSCGLVSRIEKVLDWQSEELVTEPQCLKIIEAEGLVIGLIQQLSQHRDAVDIVVLHFYERYSNTKAANVMNWLIANLRLQAPTLPKLETHLRATGMLQGIATIQNAIVVSQVQPGAAAAVTISQVNELEQ